MQVREWRYSPDLWAQWSAPREEWGPGPWDDEPDKVQWPDAATGLPCLAVRNHHGGWCGYAAVPRGHAWYGIGYSGHLGPACDDALGTREWQAAAQAWSGVCVAWTGHRSYPRMGFPGEAVWCGHTPEALIEVHGGLTYSAPCIEVENEGTGICHVPDDGEPDEVWWFGFDCGHAFDLLPGMEVRLRAVRVKHPDPVLDDLEARIPDSMRDTYRTLEYVKDEVGRLAAQLAAVS